MWNNKHWSRLDKIVADRGKWKREKRGYKERYYILLIDPIKEQLPMIQMIWNWWWIKSVNCKLNYLTDEFSKNFLSKEKKNYFKRDLNKVFDPAKFEIRFSRI